jgi:hypothetical protein
VSAAPIADLIPPHGGTLQERLAPADQHASLAERARLSLSGTTVLEAIHRAQV